MPYADPEKRRECSRRAYRRKVAADPEAARAVWRAKARKHRLRDPVAHAEYRRRRYLAGLEQPIEGRAERKRLYRESRLEAARERGRMYEQTRRIHRFGSLGTATPAEIAARWWMWYDRCWMCGDAATATDHAQPLSKGGSGWPANLRPICKPCNSSKGTQWPYDLRRRWW